MLRGIALAFVCSVVAGAVAYRVQWRRAPPARSFAELTNEARGLEQELERHGLRRVESRDSDFDGRDRIRISTGERCFGYVVVAATVDPIVARLVTPSGVRVRSSEGHTIALASCRFDDVPLELEIDYGEAFARRSNAIRVAAGRVRIVSFAGDADFDALGSPFGVVEPTMLARLRRVARAERDEREPRRDEPVVFGPVDVASHHALLLPRSEALVRWLDVAMKVGASDRRPTWAPPVHPESPRRGETSRPRDPRALGSTSGVAPSRVDLDERWRVVAVVDPGDLPFGTDARVPCVEIQLFPLDEAQVHVAMEPTGPARALPSRSERLCPGDPPRYYVVPPNVGAPVRVRIFGAEGEGPRQPAAELQEVPRALRLVWSEQACAAERAGACVDLARRHRFGTHGLVDDEAADRAYARACELDVSTCVEAGMFHGARDARPDRLARACDAGVASGCASSGDVLREAGRYPASRDAYRRACELGVAHACRNVRVLEGLGLVDPEEVR